ncbi:MAG: phenylalanine--tRNA ligase subunit beta [Gammaproteobacteria bacterium]|jgi:phenylalanyl-tRNA synthetase beta chain|nr:phenylalanine--tRNA ligase subunit beta [Gammaproteobacteria bacterium]
MKFSLKWLQEWVSPNLSVNEIADQFTMAGLEVDDIAEVAPAFNGVVVGEVVSLVQHPNADRLRVCQVNVNKPELLNIVCGAANVRQGLKVCVAMVGATLPGDFKIKPAKLRGVESFGMLCSEGELGLKENSEGIMELPEDAPVGTDIREYLHLDDSMIELSITANRGDCLSIKGLARELGALTQVPVHPPQFAQAAIKHQDSIKVEIKEAQACPRYLARVIKGVKNDIATPYWLSERLRRCGIRSISPIVDITNYVMLALGQPMHAFDLAKLHGGISVRFAKDKENLTLLNGESVQLKAQSLVIADEKAPIALAGIMGGEVSSVSTETTDIVLESAFFSPLALAGQARSYGLHTDSSHRFERGVDPAITRDAMEYASELIQLIAGGEAGPIVESVSKEHLPKQADIDLHLSKLEKILGLAVSMDEVSNALERLGFSVEQNSGQSLRAKAPSHRFDMGIEEDLIEEVARIKGYESFTPLIPAMPVIVSADSELELPTKRMKQLLVDRGYREAMNYSFIDPKLHQKFFTDKQAYPLLNPIASDLAVMRTSLIPGLIQNLSSNIARQQQRLRLFESGKCFEFDGKNPATESQVLAGLIYGKLFSEHWDNKNKSDFYDIKNDVEAVLALTTKQYEFIATEAISYLHPGKAALICENGIPVGYIGAVHPNIQQSFDLISEAFVFELKLESLNGRELPKFNSISKFPSIRRDIAIEVDELVSAQALLDEVKKAAGALLQDTWVFDIYKGGQVPTGKKSVALGLILQNLSRTLNEEEVVAIMEKLVSQLKNEFAAQLRE